MRSRSRSGTIAPSTSFTSIRLTSTTSLFVVGRLADRFEPRLAVLVAERPPTSAIVSAQRRSVGEPHGLAVGQPVGGQDLHASAPCGSIARGRACLCAASGSECSKLAPATASPMMVMTGPVEIVARLAATAGRRSVPWKQRLVAQAGILDDGDRRVAATGRPRSAARRRRPRPSGPYRRRPSRRRWRASPSRAACRPCRSWPVVKTMRGGDAAQRQRQLEIGGGGEGRGDARHDLVGDAGIAQRLPFPRRRGRTPADRRTSGARRACPRGRARPAAR